MRLNFKTQTIIQSMTRPSHLLFIVSLFILLFCVAGCEDEDNPGGDTGDTEGQQQIESDTSAIFLYVPPDIWTLASVPNTGEFDYADASNNWATNYLRARVTAYSTGSFHPSGFADGNWGNSHYSRVVYASELGPLQTSGGAINPIVNTLNIAYFPKERGPYNFNVQGIDVAGKLTTPANSWAGIQRPLDYTDFEDTGIELISFWLLDPFLESGANPGTLYLNLGRVSEDVLKDGRISCETNLPVNGNPANGENTAWAFVSNDEIDAYDFETEATAEQQDLGLDGLDDDGEAVLYAEFLTAIQNERPAIYDLISADPANDNYRSPFDQDYWPEAANWTERVLHFKQSQGNSLDPLAEQTSFWRAYRPNCEDIDQDGNLQETEAFFEYRIPLEGNMQVGQNHIVEIRIDESETATVDGVPAKWYKFEIPIEDYDHAFGGINSFDDLPFMRVYLTDFSSQVTLRMGRFNLIRIE